MSPRRRQTDNETIARLTEQRREIVGRAVHVLDSDREIPVGIEPEAFRETAALLATSLEELKVAEEELLQQNEELLFTRDAIESTSRHFRRLFHDMPLPYVVTDICGIIRHANAAAASLLKRPAALLERKPLAAFVPLDRRSTFRDGINRVQLVDAAQDWRVELLRHGDAPVRVSMDVRVSPGAHDGEDLICWVLRPLRSEIVVE